MGVTMSARWTAYDVIVAGLGGMGSAAAFHLARGGQRVLGLDAFGLGHNRGSSHGRSRIIREAYYEAPEYVPLVRRAYALWRELEAESGKRLLQITGGLTIGPPDGELVQGVKTSAAQHGIEIDVLDAGQVARRFPPYCLPGTLGAAYEANAGILDPEACVAAHCDLAIRAGAELRFAEPVEQWDVDAGGVRVRTAQGCYEASRLVIAAGAWASALIGQAGPPLDVWRVLNVHFAPGSPGQPEHFTPQRCPVFIWQVPEGWYYGMVGDVQHGVKFGRHDVGERCTPQTIRRTVDDAEVEALQAVLNRYLPGAGARVSSTLTCMYTLTPDRHFVVDRHPVHRNVVYGCGFSGHGFKFCSAIGEGLAALALDRVPPYPIEFLSARRFFRSDENGTPGYATAARANPPAVE